MSYKQQLKEILLESYKGDLTIDYIFEQLKEQQVSDYTISNIIEIYNTLELNSFKEKYITLNIDNLINQ